MTGTTDPKGTTAPAGGPFWDFSLSGAHVLSRPIVIDGLGRDELLIEILPRLRFSGGRPVDASREAVDRMAAALGSGLGLAQLVLAAVAVRIHLRRGRVHIERSRDLRERWVALARRAREAGGEGESDLRSAWEELEAEEGLLRDDGLLPPTDDLKHPFVLNLVRPAATAGRERERSAASAMQTLVEALARTLSRTDLAILEIALRRGIRCQAPVRAANLDRWEKELFDAAEEEYVAEFPLAAPYRSGGPASGPLRRARGPG